MNFRKEHYIEPWKVFVLTFITLGLYQFYWVFYTWKFVQEQTNIKINPLWRTVAILLITIAPMAMFFYNVLLITTKINNRKILFIAFILSTLDTLFSYNYHFEKGLVTNVLILVFELIYISTIFTVIQNQINKYVSKSIVIEEKTKIENISSFNPRIFQIITFISAIIEICLVYVFNLEDFNLTIAASLSVGTALYIIIKIYEMKVKKDEQ